MNDNRPAENRIRELVEKLNQAAYAYYVEDKEKIEKLRELLKQ